MRAMRSAGDVDRRYLLGQAPEDEQESLERRYFADPSALERVEAEEERLIEAYLAGALGLSEREQFEREFLGSAARRRRVDTVRRLTQAAEASASVSRMRWSGAYLPLAASLLIAVMAGWWFLAARAPEQGPGQKTAPAAEESAATATRPPASGAGSLRIVALTLSPVSTRSAGETPTVTVPRGIDAVRLDLQGDGSGAPLTRPRVIVQTVSGRKVWEGGARRAPDTPALAASAMIPASRLPADDYVIILLAEQERYRYFFRVRIP